MPLFKCPKCGVVENTAASHYWTAAPEDVACSQCETGRWHGLFPRTQATEEWIPEEPQISPPGKPIFITKKGE
jgi:hypothetical protein